MKKGAGILGVIIIALIGGGIAASAKLLPGIFKTLLIIGGVVIALIVALVIIGIIFAVKSSSSDAKADRAKKSSGASGEDAQVLAKGRQNLMELRRICMGIRDVEIHAKANDICSVIDKILTTLKEKPEKIQTTRQFFNYYLPTLGEILTKYKRIESGGVDSGDMKEKVGKYLSDIRDAMDKQYQNLFADDMLDMSVDMEAMKMAVKRDGLISETNMEVGEGEQKISLTL